MWKLKKNESFFFLERKNLHSFLLSFFSNNKKMKQRFSTTDVAAEAACLRARVLGMRVTNVYDAGASKVKRKIGEREKEKEKKEVNDAFFVSIKPTIDLSPLLPRKIIIKKKNIIKNNRASSSSSTAPGTTETRPSSSSSPTRAST